MKKIITALSMVLLLTSCIEKEEAPDTSYKFSWATADFRKIENKVFKIAKEKNPYPDPNVDRREVQTQRSRISSQISSIKREACSPTTKNSRSTTSLNARTAKAIGSPVRYDSNCYSKANNNPLVVNLNKQKQQLDKLNRKLSAHTQKVRSFAKDQTTSIIQRYSDGKFEVVVKQGRDNIVFNKNGVAIDITDALMQEIDANKLTMQPEEDTVTNVKESK